MKNLVLLVLAGCIASTAATPTCSVSACPSHLNSHYFAKNCVPVGEDYCCPTRFDCPPFQLEPDRCQYRGKSYSVGDPVPIQDDPCSIDCRCRESFSGAKIECVNVECPSLFRPYRPDCHDIHEFGECCEVDTVCGTNATLRGSMCTHKGKDYKEGDNMYFDEHPCQSCVCGPGFTGPFGPGCGPFNCGIDFRYNDRLAQGCTPIRFEEGCCPIDWLCPDDSRLPKTQGSTKGADCTLGQLGVKLGEVVDLGDCNLVCGCLTPPELTCNKYRSCELAKKTKLFTLN